MTAVPARLQQAIRAFLEDASLGGSTDADLGSADLDGLFLGDGTFLTDRALADDGNVYATVQAAVDAASSWVLVGPGTFSLSTTLTIATAELTLTGIGDGTLIQGAADLGGNLIEVDGVDDVTIEDLRAETPLGLNVGATVIAGINGASDGTIERVTIPESDADAVHVGVGGTGQGWTIRDSRIAGSIGDRGVLETGAGRAKIHDNVIEGVGSDDSTLGRFVELQGPRSKVYDNEATDAPDNGIFVNGAHNSEVYDNYLVNPASTESPAAGVEVDDADEVDVRGNYVLDSGHVGLSALDTSTAPTFENNTVIDPTGGDCVFVQGGVPGAVIVGNRLVNPADECIDAGGDEAVIVGNLARDATAEGIFVGGLDSAAGGNVVLNAGDNGIEIDTGSDDAAVVGNVIVDSADQGIRAPGDDALIASNVIKAPGIAGIAVGGDRANVGRNRITFVGGTGIDLNGTDQLASDNVIEASTGVDTAGATTPTTTDNVIV